MIDPVNSVSDALSVTTDSPTSFRFAPTVRMYAITLVQDLLDNWVLVQ